jgi:hypothetical protein
VAVVIDGGALIFRVNVCVADCGKYESLSLTEIWNVYAPGVDVTPEITPELLRVKPGGSPPGPGEATAVRRKEAFPMEPKEDLPMEPGINGGPKYHVYGGRPPVAASDTE